MDFSTDEDAEQIRDTVRRFLARHGTDDAVRAAMETDLGYDRAVWSSLAADLGVAGLGVPEDQGGSGFGFAEVAIVAEELGARLLPGPFFASRVLALGAVLLASDGATDPLVQGLAAGSTTGALALSAEPGPWTPERTSVVATAVEGASTLSGTASYVIDGATADVLVVAARDAHGIGLYAVDGAATGLVRERLETVDPTRGQGRLELAGCPARRVGRDGDQAEVVRLVLDRAVIALAAEQVGGAQRCLDLAVEHAKTRIQFGRPIGSFQAIKHKCANVLLELDAARVAVRTAAWSVDHAPDDVPLLAAMVKAHCSETYVLAARECVQIHGGMGFTWEHAAQLYFKRAHSSSLMFGTAAHHREQIVRHLGFPGVAS